MTPTYTPPAEWTADVLALAEIVAAEWDGTPEADATEFAVAA